MRRLTALPLLSILALALSGCVFVPASSLESTPASSEPVPTEVTEAEVAVQPEPSPTTTPSPTPEPEPEPELAPTPDLDAFEEVDERTLALVAKNPEAHIGKQLIAYGHVAQFDSFTGKCAIRVDLGHTAMQAWYDYEHNTIVTSGDATADCPELDPIVQDDEVKLWLTIVGAFEYDTTFGGSATSIAAHAWKIELL